MVSALEGFHCKESIIVLSVAASVRDFVGSEVRGPSSTLKTIDAVVNLDVKVECHIICMRRYQAHLAQCIVQLYMDLLVHLPAKLA